MFEITLSELHKSGYLRAGFTIEQAGTDRNQSWLSRVRRTVGETSETSRRQVGDKSETSRRQVGDKSETSRRQVGDNQ